jgi:cell division protein ZapE
MNEGGGVVSEDFAELDQQCAIHLTPRASLAEWYACHAGQHGFRLDAAQQRAVASLQRLYDELAAQPRHGWLTRFFGGPAEIRGLYLWGGVGRGKSFLMDGFFACAPVEKKRRLHFHRFMQGVHAELKTLPPAPDPLIRVAARIAEHARLLCFDEFHVNDIGDAMLLGRLLRELVANGVVLVATSNNRPDDLYKDGLQRSRFLPAIDLIETHLDVVEVDGGADYRLRALERVQIYHCPLDAQAEVNLDSAYWSLAGESGMGAAVLELDGRRLLARHRAPGVAWFDFDELCGGPHGQPDYIELARRFHTVLLSGVPHLSDEQEAAARRLTWLVDEFYDRRVKLILSAAAPPHELYSGGHSEFARTVSRLEEMQTKQYLALAHLP